MNNAVFVTCSQKTFLDRWLLGLDLTAYTQPFEFSKLNALEKILLAQALPKQTAFVAQFVIDHAALQANDPQRFITLFKVPFFFSCDWSRWMGSQS
jgi:hypothetical protein